MTRNYNDGQISDIVGLSRERIRQLRGFLGLDVTHEACSPIIKEEDIGRIIELSKSHTQTQIAKEMGVSPATIKKYLDKYKIEACIRPWKIHPDLYKEKFESCGGIIREAAKQLGISYICALRYTRALGLKSSYNRKPLDKSSKYDGVRDEIIKELREGKSLRDICKEKGISENGFRNHIMYKGITVQEAIYGKEPRNDY